MGTSTRVRAALTPAVGRRTNAWCSARVCGGVVSVPVHERGTRPLDDTRRAHTRVHALTRACGGMVREGQPRVSRRLLFPKLSCPRYAGRRPAHERCAAADTNLVPVRIDRPSDVIAGHEPKPITPCLRASVLILCRVLRLLRLRALRPLRLRDLRPLRCLHAGSPGYHRFARWRRLRRARSAG